MRVTKEELKGLVEAAAKAGADCYEPCSATGAMIYCRGCGFNVEREDVRSDISVAECTRCHICATSPKIRESHRRGFNAGLEAMAKAMTHAAHHSGLRRGVEDDD